MKYIHHFDGLFLHSDNGSPMRAFTLLERLRELGIVPSFSRPSVSNDNPFIESFNSTLKRSIEYPSAFTDITHARRWMADFVDWYNTVHLHSAIGYVTPHQRRTGQDHEIFAIRNQTLLAARSERPERWVRGARLYTHEPSVVLNPADRNAAEKLSKNLLQLC